MFIWKNEYTLPAVDFPFHKVTTMVLYDGDVWSVIYVNDAQSISTMLQSLFESSGLHAHTGVAMLTPTSKLINSHPEFEVFTNSTPEEIINTALTKVLSCDMEKIPEHMNLLDGWIKGDMHLYNPTNIPVNIKEANMKQWYIYCSVWASVEHKLKIHNQSMDK